MHASEIIVPEKKKTLHKKGKHTRDTLPMHASAEAPWAAMSSRNYSAHIRAMLEEALMDKFLNPDDWKRKRAAKYNRNVPKKLDIMLRTGLSGRQVQQYMHNHAPKGKRLVQAMMDWL